jgi:tight adherence protein B
MLGRTLSPLRWRLMLKEKNKSELLVRLSTIVSSTFLITVLLTRTIVIALAISSVSVVMILISSKRRISKKSSELLSVVPEVIDHMISGIQSGLSLSEVLSNLSERGPALTQKYFQEFKDDLNSGTAFEVAVSKLQEHFDNRAADQLFEALIFAKNLGGSDLLSMLRQLGDFTRQDLSLRREIDAKQGWIRNSAHLSAGAPWILLLLLSAQPATGNAFATPQGATILAFGVGMTAIAYLWMGKLSELPQPKRIFGLLK